MRRNKCFKCLNIFILFFKMFNIQEICKKIKNIGFNWKPQIIAEINRKSWKPMKSHWRIILYLKYTKTVLEADITINSSYLDVQIRQAQCMIWHTFKKCQWKSYIPFAATFLYNFEKHLFTLKLPLYTKVKVQDTSKINDMYHGMIFFGQVNKQYL